MAEVNPPFVLQSEAHPSDVFRRLVEALLGGRTGVRGASDLLVSALATPNMSVNVAAGEAFVPGTESASPQGAYHVYNDATENLTVAASDPTNPRNDLVVAKVQDSQYSGATDAWSLAVVTGTPSATPADPATPANAILLARVRVDATVTTIVAGKITDLRERASALNGAVICTSTTRPTGAGLFEGLEIFETDTDKSYIYDGAAWVETGDLGAWDAFTPTWTGATSNPAIGNGTLQGAYRLVGRTLFIRVRMIAGSTTTFGSGAWRFALPSGMTAKNGTSQPLVCHMIDTGTRNYIGAAHIGVTTGLYDRFVVSESTNEAQSSHPFAWGNGDTLIFAGTIEID